MVATPRQQSFFDYDDSIETEQVKKVTKQFNEVVKTAPKVDTSQAKVQETADKEANDKLRERLKLLNEIARMEEKLNRVGKNEKAERESLLEKKRSQVEELNKYLDEARENSEQLNKSLEKQDEAYKGKQSITEAKQKDLELQQEFNSKVAE